MATGKYGGQSVFFLVDGYNLIANKLKALRYKQESILERTDGFGDSWEEHTPTGLSKIELAQEGAFFDTDTNRIHTAMSASVPTSPQAAVRIICLGFAGATVGEMFVGLQGAFSMAYDVLAQLGALTKANVQYAITGQINRGTILQPLATKTADWNTKTLGTTVDYRLDSSQKVTPITANSLANPTVVTTAVAHGLTTGDLVFFSGSNSTPVIDGSRAVTVISTTTFSVPVNVTVAGTAGTYVRDDSTAGGVGYQQVSAFSGFSGFIGRIQDSLDDVTYATVVTFVDVTSAPNAQRVTAAGQIDRYLSYDGNVTGTGSITAFSGFSRS